MFMGYIINHNDVDKATRHTAKRNIDMISGGIAIYSWCLTNNAYIKSVQETCDYDVADGIAILTEEENNGKDTQYKTRRIEDERKKEEKLGKLAAEAQKKYEVIQKK